LEDIPRPDEIEVVVGVAVVVVVVRDDQFGSFRITRNFPESRITVGIVHVERQITAKVEPARRH
jgi:hypothetical protein